MRVKDRFRLAGKEMMRGNIGNAMKSFLISSDSYTKANGGLYFFAEDGKAVHFQYENVNSSLKAYMKCPAVTAIINRKAQAFINGKTFLTNTAGKARGKEATGEIANQVRAVMKRPNGLQTWHQFEVQNYIYQQISGYCVVLPVKPVGFPNYKATSLWNVPPWMLNIIEKPNINLLTAKSLKDFIALVQIVWGGLVINLNLDDIYIFKDFTVSPSSFAIPESRLCSLAQPVNNIIGAYESRNVLINRRGALGILSNQAKDVNGFVPLDPEDKKLLEDDFKRYGLRRDQAQFIVTNASLSWQQMGYPTKDLMLFEEVQDDMERICDAFGFPPRLLGSPQGNSLGGNDVKIYDKNLYQNTIIPESCNIYQQWNQFFDLEKYGLELTKDYKHIPALQEDQLNEALALYRRNQGAQIQFYMNLITLNEWREINDQDPMNGDLGDLYYYELVEKGVKFGQGPAGANNPEQTNTDTQNSSDGNSSNNNA
jgi:phage portal protein BeeE